MTIDRQNWEKRFIRVGVYSLPAVMDVVLSAMWQATMLRATDLRGSGMVNGSLAAVWAVVYMLGSLALAPLVTRRRVAAFLGGSCAVLAMTAIGLIFWKSLWGLWAMTAVSGFASAAFFVPFQLFMKLIDEGQNKGVARSAGSYTFAWSVGYGVGPFVIGLLWRHGWAACQIFSAVASLLTGIGVLLLKHHAEVHAPPVVSAFPVVVDSESAPPARGTATVAPRENRLPDLAWMAWIFSGIASMFVTMVRSQLPISARHHNVSAETLGVILFALSMSQGIVAWLLGYTKRWMYQAGPVFAFGFCGVVALAAFGLSQSVPVMLLAGVVLGAYTGAAYFYLVYHSLIHPIRSGRYVAVNEAVVGVAGAVGPAMGGVLGDYVGLWVPYIVSAGIVLLAVSSQAMLHARLRTDRAAKAALAQA